MQRLEQKKGQNLSCSLLNFVNGLPVKSAEPGSKTRLGAAARPRPQLTEARDSPDLANDEERGENGPSAAA